MYTVREGEDFDAEQSDTLAPLPSEIPDEPEDGWNLTEPVDDEEEPAPTRKPSSLLDAWKDSNAFSIPDPDSVVSVKHGAAHEEFDEEDAASDGWQDIDWTKSDDAEVSTTPMQLGSTPYIGGHGYSADYETAALLGRVPLYHNTEGKHIRLRVQRLSEEGTPVDIGHLPATASDLDLIAKFKKPGIFHVWPIDAFGKLVTKDPLYLNIAEDHEHLTKVLAGGKIGPDPVRHSSVPQSIDSMSSLLTFLKERDRADQAERQIRESRLHDAQESIADERLKLNKAYAGMTATAVDQATVMFSALIDKDSKRHDETYKEMTRFHTEARAIDREAHIRDLERQQSFASNQLSMQTQFMDKMMVMHASTLEERKLAVKEEQLAWQMRMEEQRREDERRREEERRRDDERRREWLAQQERERDREREHQKLVMELMHRETEQKMTANNPVLLLGSLAAMAAPVLGALREAGVEPKDLLGGLFGGGAPEPEKKSWFGELLDFGKEGLKAFTAMQQVAALEEDEEGDDDEDWDEEEPAPPQLTGGAQVPSQFAPPPGPQAVPTGPAIPDGFMQVPPPPQAAPPPQTVHELSPEQRKAARQTLNGLVTELGTSEPAAWADVVSKTFGAQGDILAPFLSGTTVRKALAEAGATDAMIAHVIAQFDAAGVDASIPRG